MISTNEHLNFKYLPIVEHDLDWGLTGHSTWRELSACRAPVITQIQAYKGAYAG